ncbi:hypothetical protein CLV31_103134 [Algoriphagus aquaeductus]|uniref:Uncharacterized protein n=1 Tax=Algoriphagus aquaeductus TaxID=475299 RepID=A0A326RVR5_9BACT|nr:hypothetical protein CLV31_103134 [Algoriphagus aquaeductus]
MTESLLKLGRLSLYYKDSGEWEVYLYLSFNPFPSRIIGVIFSIRLS